MKFLMIAIAIFSLPLASCANPEYAQKNKIESLQADCDVYFEKLTACGKLTWSGTSVSTPGTQFQMNIVEFSDSSQIEKLAGASLKVILWMPSMGHGSSPTSVNKISDTSFDVSNVHFIMGGYWEIRFELYQGSTLIDKTMLALEI